MQRLIYRSKASDNLRTIDVQQIVKTAVRRNRDRAITGFLIYHSNKFLQLLEGPSVFLDMLMEELKLDPRHNDIEVLIRGDAGQRWFPDWRLQPLISFSEDRVFDEVCAVLQAKPDREKWHKIVMDFLEY